MSTIMSWSECSIKIGKTGASDAMAVTLVSIGTIKDKSAGMDQADGEKKEAKATGGVLIATEYGEPTTTLKARVIEPDFALLATLIDATHDTVGGTLVINSLVVSDPYSVEVSPKNIGATGVKVRKAQVSYKEGWSEDEGHFADFTFTVLQCADGELYKKFKKTA